MSNKNQQKHQQKPIIHNSQQATKSYNENKIFKKSLSFQDTENMTCLDASNIQDYLINNNPVNINNNNFTHNLKSSIEKPNYDRDDSLNDVISFGKQTPFRFDNSNMNSFFDVDPRVNLAGSNDYGN